ncbi:MAG: FkbM family methyltransferase, partial [Algicola sp.]|nr:FkbM family methyltransferase [Algicola sp.]
TANESVKFYTIGAGAAGSMHADHAKSAAAINSHSMVTTVTLDDLYAYYNLSPDLVKIDVEGAETQVMKGAEKLAKESQCAFFIEMHHVKNVPMIEGAKQMLLWCEKHNYVAWYLKTGKPLEVPETIAHRGKCHLLLLPKGTEYPEYLKEIKPHHPLPESIHQ